MVKGATPKSLVLKRIIAVLLAVLFVAAIGDIAFKRFNTSLFQKRSNNIRILMGRITLSIEDSLEKNGII